MILSDFLSRQTHNDSNLQDNIPISYNMHNTLHEKYYNIETNERYLVQMHLQTKSSGIKLPEVHGVKKTLDTSLLPKENRK